MLARIFSPKRETITRYSMSAPDARPNHRGNRSVGRNMLVDSNSQRGSVVLRNIEIDLDSDIGCGFVTDCARFCEGLLAEDKIKSKYGLADSAWARLAENEPLVQAVETEKTRRVRDGTAAREKRSGYSSKRQMCSAIF